MPETSEKRLILASASPRRKSILENLGLNFKVVPSNYEEEKHNLPPQEYVLKNAIQKAEEVVRRYPNDIIIGADTVGVFEETILEKPQDEKEARKMLNLLSNTTHEVVTAICMINGRDGKRTTTIDITKVRFATLSREEVDMYINSGEWEGKAAAYAIQGVGSLFVKNVNGDFYNVVGLPVNKFYRLFKTQGIDINDYRH